MNIFKGKEFPHVYVILISIVLLSAVLSYIVPAGKYDRVTVDGREVVDAQSYHEVEQHPISIMGFLEAVPKGLIDTSNIIFFIFIVGGSFGVLKDTGAVDIALKRLASTMRDKGLIAIPPIMIAFSLAGAVIGMAEETLPFIPIVAALMEGLGFDTITGAIVVLCGAGAGFAAALTNPFTIGIAQGIAGLPMFSGLMFRVVMFIAYVSLSTGYAIYYATKIRKSMVLAPNVTRETTSDSARIGPREKAILAVFLATIVVVVIGVIKYQWYMTEIAAVFLAQSMIIGFIARMGFNGWATSLSRAMAGITSGALIVGFAKGIPIILGEGEIMDTILHAGAVVLNSLPRFLMAIGMYIVQCLLNFFIPSGGGQAAVSMPIMAPLGDMIGITRQTAVIAFQLGDGISNVFFPTSGYFMAGLALVDIPWQKWARAVLPLILMQYALGAIFIIVAAMIKLGPY